MRLVTFEKSGRLSLGVLVGDAVLDLPRAARAGGISIPTTMLGLLRGGNGPLAAVAGLLPTAPGTSWLPLASVRLTAPIPRPDKNVFAIGLNYAEHVTEGASARREKTALPEYPAVFTKAPTCVIGPHDPIELHEQITSQLDWEGELAVIIGRPGRQISRADAMGHVFGYAVANDISARDLQRKYGGQFFVGKSLDNTCPLGPSIVTADEVLDPHDLSISLRVNGITKQSAHTSMMIFDIPSIIELISSGISLDPGDIILTGTPAGVGYARTPPEFLHHGDLVEVHIEGLGALHNQVRASSAPETSARGPDSPLAVDSQPFTDPMPLDAQLDQARHETGH